MPKPLQTITVGAPGFYGLNTQDAGSVLPPGWATKATNFVYDDQARLTSRFGTKQTNGTVIPSSPTVEAFHEYVDASGSVLNIFAANNKIYKEVSGTITEITNTITAPTGNDWQFANFNGTCVGYQSGHAPITMATVGAAGFTDATGTQKNGNCVLSAFGRLWTIESNTLWYSDLLINNYTGGSSGNFDLSKFWPSGMDEGIALAEFQGFLLVFGEHSILIYENPDDVTNMVLRETIDGIGCIARDSIQKTGNDLVFLSHLGVRSLGKLLVNQSLPNTDLSRHVRDSLLIEVNSETPVNIKSVYSPLEGFYLLSLPTTGKSYYFDLKFPNEDGSWKVLSWDIAPTAMTVTRDNVFYLCLTDGYVSQYLTNVHQDEQDSAGANGTDITVDFEGVWNDFGQDVSEYLKILKTVSVVGAGGVASPVIFKWALDYNSNFQTISLDFNTVSPAQWSVGQYGISTYGTSAEFERVREPISHTGYVVKMGLVTTTTDQGFSLQRIDLLAKIGRIGI